VNPEDKKSVPIDLEKAEQFEQAVRKDGRYPLDAFEFLHRGLELATRRKYKKTPRKGQHVSGQELALALRDLAIRQWGPLAREVLRRWNIHRTRDFGEMVYFMIHQSWWGRQDTDDITDFDDVYDFRATFDQYQIDAAPAEEDDASDADEAAEG
jgi:uncharacterized repeat protein (TIGR04138 family)